MATDRDRGRDRDRGGSRSGPPSHSRGPPPSRAHIELNKQIMRCTAGQLCELISSRVHSFDHVNVATAFRKLLQSGRGGVSRGAMEGALEQLEAWAVETMPAFGPQ